LSGAALSHLFVHVTSLSRTREFWVDHIGLEVLVDEPDYVRVGGGDGFHMGIEERPMAEVGSVGIEVVVRVDDVDARVARLRGLGLQVEGPDDTPWGARHAWLHDPDGYRVSIYTPLPPAAPGRP